MLKRIKIIGDWFDHNGDNQIGKEFDAMVVEDKANGHLNGTVDVGADYAFGLSNMKNSDPTFEIIGDVTDNNASDALENLKGELKGQSERLQDAYETISDLQDEIKEHEKNKEITREHFDGGYVIIPTKFLDKELADEFKGNEGCIITPKEIVAMCASAQLEINKGDVRPTSLNVKLYNAINDFAQDELDTMIDSGKAQ